MKSLDYNSTENQKTKGEFVGREVYANVNQMVEYIIQKSFDDNDAPISYEDIDYYRFTHDGSFSRFEEIKSDKKYEAVSELEQLVDLIKGGEGTVEITDTDGFDYLIPGQYTTEQIEDIEDEIYDVENLDCEYVEVYEWWIVSGWLADKLEEKGEVVISGENIWGRRTTGQAILLDFVISDICNDMKMLK